MGDGQTERRFQPADRAGESITFNGADPDAQYRFVIETYINASAEYEFEGAVESRQGIETPDVDFGANTDVDPFADIDYDPDGDDSVDPPTPKTVGWYNEAERYTGEQRPRDPNGHGSHCAGIMSGTGEASVIDYQNTTKEEPQAIILPTEFIEYEVDVRSTSTVFVSALGDNVLVETVYDGEVVHQTGVRTDSIIADEPAVHDSGTETYTLRVRRRKRVSATTAPGAPVKESLPTVAPVLRCKQFLTPPARSDGYDIA